jgi:hypothetical protein
MPVEVQLALAHLERIVRSNVPANRQRILALEELEVIGFRLGLACGEEPFTGAITVLGMS